MPLPSDKDHQSTAETQPVDETEDNERQQTAPISSQTKRKMDVADSSSERNSENVEDGSGCTKPLFSDLWVSAAMKSELSSTNTKSSQNSPSQKGDTGNEDDHTSSNSVPDSNQSVIVKNELVSDSEDSETAGESQRKRISSCGRAGSGSSHKDAIDGESPSDADGRESCVDTAEMDVKGELEGQEMKEEAFGIRLFERYLRGFLQVQQMAASSGEVSGNFVVSRWLLL